MPIIGKLRNYLSVGMRNAQVPAVAVAPASVSGALPTRLRSINNDAYMVVFKKTEARLPRRRKIITVPKFITGRLSFLPQEIRTAHPECRQKHKKETGIQSPKKGIK